MGKILKTMMMLRVAGMITGAVGGASPVSAQGTITERPFGVTKEGQAVKLYTLRNSRGVEAGICDYGGILVTMKVPDRKGNFADVTLGYDQPEDYLGHNTFFGALVGRYANRIAKGKFTLAGKEFTLARNNGPNALHGGLKGFNSVVWESAVVRKDDGPVLQLRYLSRDGEEGYPGNLSVTAVYRLTEDNGLQLEFTATTDRETIVNLSQHSYFNLAARGDVLDHVVMIAGDRFTPVDETLIPTGELKPVAGTPFDFRAPTAIRARIGAEDAQLKLGHGFDHNWVINKPLGKLGLMARVYEPVSGRVLEVLSTQPGVQFYTANFANGNVKGKGGWVYQSRNGFCLEAEHYPDSPNHPNFPPVTLKPGEVYHETIIYRFSVRPE